MSTRIGPRWQTWYYFYIRITLNIDTKLYFTISMQDRQIISWNKIKTDLDMHLPHIASFTRDEGTTVGL